MYAFAQRRDTRCLDEPLYGAYLKRSGAQHPGHTEVMAAMDCDGERVVQQQLLGDCATPVLFAKMMAHHLPGLDQGFLDRVQNVLLTRDPAEVLPSLDVQVPNPTLDDTGYLVQVELLERFPALPVLDARELLRDPAGVLSQLCGRLGLDWDPGMLAWPAGPKSCDGVWAPHWYHNVHRSTGFAPYRRKSAQFPPRLQPQLDQARPLYERLAKRALKAENVDP